MDIIFCTIVVAILSVVTYMSWCNLEDECNYHIKKPGKILHELTVQNDVLKHRKENKYDSI